DKSRTNSGLILLSKEVKWLLRTWQYCQKALRFRSRTCFLIFLPEEISSNPTLSKCDILLTNFTGWLWLTRKSAFRFFPTAANFLIFLLLIYDSELSIFSEEKPTKN